MLAIALTLAACGPVPPDVAADRCEERARAAAGPTGEVRAGVATGEGVKTGFDVTISSDFLLGRDPQLVYENCVRDLTGAGPIRPLRL